MRHSPDLHPRTGPRPKSRTFGYLLTTLMLLGLGVLSCGGPREVVNPSFRNDVRPIIANFCKCHATERGTAPYLGTRGAIVEKDLSITLVNITAPENSNLILVLEDRGKAKMPPGTNSLPRPMIRTILNWIRAGAPDN